MFIVFEGVDGSGKTTQIKALKKYFDLMGKRVFLTREPGGTEFGDKIRELLLSGDGVQDPITEYLLFTAARRENVEKVIKPHLRDGFIVISDRFIGSSIVYQGCLKGMNLDDIKTIYDIAVRDIKPDITFVMDVQPNIGFKRLKERQMNHYDSMDFEIYNKIREGFLRIDAEVIDTSQDQKTTHRDIVNLINKKLCA